MSKAIIKAFEERQRQINEEGFDAALDDHYVQGQLTQAAIAYAMHDLPATLMGDDDSMVEFMEDIWPWDSTWWKPSPDPKRNIIKAMALLAAEYDRIERAETAAAGAQQNTKTVWSNNDEEFNYDDLYELISDSERQTGDTVYAGDSIKHLPSTFAVRTALSVIDGMQDEAYNFADEASAGFADCSKEQIDLLQALIDAWADATLTVEFYGITGTHKHTITAEDVEASQ